MSNLRYVIISQVNCGYCEKAKKLIEEHEYEFEELDVEPLKPFLKALGLTTVPQVFEIFEGMVFHVGTYEDLLVDLPPRL